MSFPHTEWFVVNETTNEVISQGFEYEHQALLVMEVDLKPKYPNDDLFVTYENFQEDIWKENQNNNNHITPRRVMNGTTKENKMTITNMISLSIKYWGLCPDTSSVSSLTWWAWSARWRGRLRFAWFS